MAHRLVSLIAPPLCGVCGEGCGSEDPVCAVCADAIAAERPRPLSVPAVDHAWAAARYEGVPRRLVTALKFGKRLALADVAAAAIASTTPAPPAAATIVPVPADPWRLRLRGFDPAALIATSLANHLGLPASDCLARRHGRRQVGKARTARLAGAPALRLTNAPPVTAVLVDDVATTGATLAACARALRSGGAEKVLAVAFAQA